MLELVSFWSLVGLSRYAFFLIPIFLFIGMAYESHPGLKKEKSAKRSCKPANVYNPDTTLTNEEALEFSNYWLGLVYAHPQETHKESEEPLTFRWMDKKTASKFKSLLTQRKNQYLGHIKLHAKRLSAQKVEVRGSVAVVDQSEEKFLTVPVRLNVVKAKKGLRITELELPENSNL